MSDPQNYTLHAKSLVEKHRKGFNGVEFDQLYLSEPGLDDYLGDGLTEAKWREDLKDRALLYADPINPTWFGFSECEYVSEPEFDESRWRKDWLDMLWSEFPGAIINHSCVGEYEIIRNDQAALAKARGETGEGE